MEIGPLLFAGSSIVVGFLIMQYLRGWIARLLLVTLMLTLMFLGPEVFGRDWFHEGFVAGVFMGDFYGTVATREEVEAERQ